MPYIQITLQKILHSFGFLVTCIVFHQINIITTEAWPKERRSSVDRFLLQGFFFILNNFLQVRVSLKLSLSFDCYFINLFHDFFFSTLIDSFCLNNKVRNDRSVIRFLVFSSVIEQLLHYSKVTTEKNSISPKLLSKVNGKLPRGDSLFLRTIIHIRIGVVFISWQETDRSFLIFFENIV